MSSFDPFSAMVGPVYDPFQTASGGLMGVDGGSSGGILGDLFGLGSSIIGALQMPTYPVPASPPGTGPYGGPVGFPMPTPGGAGLPFPISVRVRGRRTLGSHRRMNPCNSRALTRAIRRVKRFEKFAKKSVRISQTVKLRKGTRGSKKCR